ncbi:oligosaccharide flippase family protein [Gilvimarinus sp. SDUM040013]|uniref:Oligosaccharide flippase family protein n=1 Tax=Gilvimarinus gilvus TaxID=3058038 RepID=A0ABU4RVC5_9GAMM|nr:oligosaccharide flippase family protein [Gilvimarinus sp. SDUM040013]MDO3386844.1 oligosaccharide flippase family protein [Gilvimarinus sp. SDUM040013]MDX6848226.1 oligosaccharide flippase family protein [Gilvimarinus sp. SDUM040013]
MRGRLLKGGALTMALKLINLGLMFITSIILARILGTHDYGSYIFVFTLVGLLSEPVFLALRTVAIRNGTIYLEQTRYDYLQGMIQMLGKVVCISGFFSTAVLMLCAFFLKDRTEGGHYTLYLVAAVLPFIWGVNRIKDGLLRSAGSVFASQAPKLLFRPLLLLVYVFITWWLLDESFNASWAMAMQILAAASAALLYGWLFRGRYNEYLDGVEAKHESREWRKSMVPLIFTGVFENLNTRIGILLIGLLMAPAQTGVFHAAYRLAELIVLAFASANVVFEPHMARLYHNGEHQALQRKLTTIARLVFALSLPVAAVMIIWGEWILSLWGKEFATAAPALTILAATQLVNAAFGSSAMLLLMTHYAKIAASGLMLGVCIKAALCFALIPHYGITGAAWAAFGGMLITKIYLMIRAETTLGLHTSVAGAAFARLFYTPKEH